VVREHSGRDADPDQQWPIEGHHLDVEFHAGQTAEAAAACPSGTRGVEPSVSLQYGWLSKMGTEQVGRHVVEHQRRDDLLRPVNARSAGINAQSAPPATPQERMPRP
jgi:hypothetical protein